MPLPPDARAVLRAATRAHLRSLIDRPYTCNTCGGRGSVVADGWSADDAGPFPLDGCPTCQGVGRVADIALAYRRPTTPTATIDGEELFL